MTDKKKKPKHPGGRPTVLTDEVQEKIVGFIRGGNYIEIAASCTGVSRKTFYEWLRRGAREPGTIFEKFLNAVEKAEAESEAASILRITKAGQDGAWQADMTRLERKHPERWGRKNAVEISGPGGAPIRSVNVNLNALSTEQLLKLREIAEAAKPAEITDGKDDAVDAEFEEI